MPLRYCLDSGVYHLRLFAIRVPGTLPSALRPLFALFKSPRRGTMLAVWPSTYTQAVDHLLTELSE
jgi:hypothetical protein